jgi:peroxin-5
MEQGFSEAKLTYEDEQKNIMDSSSSMLETMMNDPDPRFQNSQFLHFLKRINKGEIKIEGKEIKEVQPDLQAMDKAWSEAELVHQSNLANLDPAFQDAKLKEAEETIKAQTMLEENWKEKLENYEQEYANQAEFEKMLEEKYMSVLQEMNLDLG